MKLFRLVLLLYCVQGMAQTPGFPTDSLRAGIKTRTYSICGYGRRGDSTGMVVYDYKKCDAKGRVTVKTQVDPIAMESDGSSDFSSWFYDIHGYLSKDNDSTWYKYDSKGRLTEYRWYSKLNGKRKTLYTYNAAGRCVKEQYYKDGVLNYTETYVYDISGKFIGSTVVRDQKKSSWTTVSYDSLGRETLKVLFRDEGGKIYRDTFRTIYGPSSVTKSGGTKYSFEINTVVYSDYDSVMVRYNSKIYSQNQGRTDTTFYIRDSVSHQLLQTINRTSYGTSVKNYKYENGKLQSITSKYNDVTNEVLYYDVQGRLIKEEYYRGGELYSVEKWSYNEKGDIFEVRSYTPDGKMVQRELYTYTYY